jgi:hypothetical protein
MGKMERGGAAYVDPEEVVEFLLEVDHRETTTSCAGWGWCADMTDYIRDESALGVWVWMW